MLTLLVATHMVIGLRGEVQVLTLQLPATALTAMGLGGEVQVLTLQMLAIITLTTINGSGKSAITTINSSRSSGCSSSSSSSSKEKIRTCMMQRVILNVSCGSSRLGRTQVCVC